MDVDLGAMIDGFRALMWLDEHSDAVGLGGGSCQGCSRYAAALLGGADPQAVLELRCGVAQAMQRQVDAAIEVIQRRCP